jgi:hypothetical protein
MGTCVPCLRAFFIQSYQSFVVNHPITFFETGIGKEAMLHAAIRGLVTIAFIHGIASNLAIGRMVFVVDSTYSNVPGSNRLEIPAWDSSKRCWWRLKELLIDKGACEQHHALLPALLLC